MYWSNLPGHLFSLQRLCSPFSPGQGSPPKKGPSQTLCLCWIPPPQVLLQVPQELHACQRPSTKDIFGRNKNFSNHELCDVSNAFILVLHSKSWIWKLSFFFTGTFFQEAVCCLFPAAMALRATIRWSVALPSSLLGAVRASSRALAPGRPLIPGSIH